jgi:hypothetical protein
MRSILRSFKCPKVWEKLQSVTYNLRRQCGLPDNRVDCAANSLAFVGAMDRDSAEEFAKSLNLRYRTVNVLDIASYFTGDGYERTPHYIQRITPETNIEHVYSCLEEGDAALISLNRISSSGHTATVIRIDGQLAVFDPQTEMIYYNIQQWLESESACSVDLIVKVNKVSHGLEESNICVSKETDVTKKFRRLNDPAIKKTANPIKRPTHAERKKEKSLTRFIHSLEEAGFDYNQFARL